MANANGKTKEHNKGRKADRAMERNNEARDLEAEEKEEGEIAGNS